jgi:hypothetical protein
VIFEQFNCIRPREPAHCDRAGYPSCYSIGYSAGQSNPGSGCPSGHSTNYCNGWDAGAAQSGGSAPQQQQYHMADYWYGYKIGQEDGKAGLSNSN